MRIFLLFRLNILIFFGVFFSTFAWASSNLSKRHTFIDPKACSRAARQFSNLAEPVHSPLVLLIIADKDSSDETESEVDFFNFIVKENHQLIDAFACWLKKKGLTAEEGFYDYLYDLTSMGKSVFDPLFQYGKKRFYDTKKLQDAEEFFYFLTYETGQESPMHLVVQMFYNLHKKKALSLGNNPPDNLCFLFLQKIQKAVSMTHSDPEDTLFWYSEYAAQIERENRLWFVYFPYVKSLLPKRFENFLAYIEYIKPLVAMIQNSQSYGKNTANDLQNKLSSAGFHLVYYNHANGYSVQYIWVHPKYHLQVRVKPGPKELTIAFIKDLPTFKRNTSIGFNRYANGNLIIDNPGNEILKFSGSLIIPAFKTSKDRWDPALSSTQIQKALDNAHNTLSGPNDMRRHLQKARALLERT